MGTIGATVGKGGGSYAYENGKGVIMSVRSAKKGVALNLVGGSVRIRFAE